MTKLKPESLVALIDTREQHPLDVSPLQVESATLATGDYSLSGMETEIAIERKSLPDLLACVGRERERFEREIQRLLAYRVRCIVVESTWAQIEMGEWRSKLTPNQVSSSLVRWSERGIQVHMVGNHERAGRIVAKLLFLAAKREHDRLQRTFRGLRVP